MEKLPQIQQKAYSIIFRVTKKNDWQLESWKAFRRIQLACLKSYFSLILLFLKGIEEA